MFEYKNLCEDCKHVENCKIGEDNVNSGFDDMLMRSLSPDYTAGFDLKNLPTLIMVVDECPKYVQGKKRLSKLL